MNSLRMVLANALPLLRLSAQAREISICADPDSTPWTYWVRDSQHAKTSTMAGSSVENSLTPQVFYRAERPLRVTRMADLKTYRGCEMLGHPDLRHNAVVDATAPAKHLIAAKGGEAACLLPEINAILDSMNRSGELSGIWKKQMPAGPFKS